MIKTLLLPATLILGASPAFATDVPAQDIRFDVYRNGSPFGEHIVRFSPLGNGDVDVDIEIELSVRLGPITVVRYEHQAVERWDDDELVLMRSRTFKDGGWLEVDVERGPGGDLVSVGEMLGDLIPSSHWRGYAPGTDAILNTETGEPMPVEVTDLGLAMIETANGAVEARGYRMAGSVTVDLWYDANGRWVGCEFEARGQRIRYVLQDA